jgi:hypothetical protein
LPSPKSRMPPCCRRMPRVRRNACRHWSQIDHSIYGPKTDARFTKMRELSPAGRPCSRPGALSDAPK